MIGGVSVSRLFNYKIANGYLDLYRRIREQQEAAIIAERQEQEDREWLKALGESQETIDSLVTRCGMSLHEIVREIKKAFATTYSEPLHKLADLVCEIRDVFRDYVCEDVNTWPVNKNTVQTGIRPYRVENKGFDKRNPYMYRNYRRRS